MRQCQRCEVVKPLHEFYKEKNRKDEYRTWCKRCVVRSTSDWQKAHPIQRAMQLKLWKLKHREHWCELKRLHQKRHRADQARKKRHDRAAYPEVFRAREAVKRAVKNGRLQRPTQCTKCHQTKRLYAHHPNYQQPLKVQWLCNPCHRLIHPGTKRPEGR